MFWETVKDAHQELIDSTVSEILDILTNDFKLEGEDVCEKVEGFKSKVLESALFTL